MTHAEKDISRRKRDAAPASLERERGPNIRERVQRLVTEMELALKNNEPVNLSNPPHREITEALHAIVYSENLQPDELAVVYNDVSPNVGRKRFPVHCLSLPREWPKWEDPDIAKKLLNIGTLSFRHVSYDDFVDFYLIRDRETRALNSYEIQDLAYERMLNVLSDPALSEIAYISLFQTGLEPLVVGVYQAIVEHLKIRRTRELSKLYVRPVFFATRDRGEDFGSRKYWG